MDPISREVLERHMLQARELCSRTSWLLFRLMVRAFTRFLRRRAAAVAARAQQECDKGVARA